MLIMAAWISSSRPTYSSSGPHKSLMNFVHLPFLDTGFSCPGISSPCLPTAPRHSSTHLNLFSFGVSLLWGVEVGEGRKATFPSYFQPSNWCFFLEKHHLPRSQGGSSLSQVKLDLQSPCKTPDVAAFANNLRAEEAGTEDPRGSLGFPAKPDR